jgi:putative component of membrane protein insertase Oxa1/YidC/SpoIIIJ protein YidD
MPQTTPQNNIGISFAQNSALSIVRGYQYIRPTIDQLNYVVFGYASTCKHTPTCSEYAKEVILKYGTMRGIALGVKRILSCR